MPLLGIDLGFGLAELAFQESGLGQGALDSQDNCLGCLGRP